MEITIKIQGLDGLANAINNLAAAITGEKAEHTASQNIPVQQNLNSVTPQNTPIQQTAQIPAGQPVQTRQPVNQQIPAQVPVNQQPVNTQPVQNYQQTAVPTTAIVQEYTQDQLAVAMTGLMDMGKQQQLMEILQSFGAQSLMQIPKERYAELATVLRGAGANI